MDESGDRRGDAAEDDLVVWRARLRVRDVGSAVVTAAVFAAFLVGLHALRPTSLSYSWLDDIVVPLSLAAAVITATRGRVVLRRDGIEIRRVRTRFYSWSSIRSIELDDEENLRITPNGWLKHVPVPRSQRREVMAEMERRRARAWPDSSTSGEVEV